MNICNVLNWMQEIALHCAVLLIVVVLQRAVNSCNVVNWIQEVLSDCIKAHLLPQKPQTVPKQSLQHCCVFCVVGFVSLQLYQLRFPQDGGRS